MNKHKMYSAEQLEVISAPRDEKTVVVATAASGKALKNGSIVYTEDGTKKIEDLQIGDEIFSSDGNLYPVSGIFPQGKRQEWKVTLSDKTEIICCNEHLWTFQTETQRSNKSNSWTTATLQEIIDNIPIFKPARAKNNFGNKPSNRKNIFLPLTEPVNFKEKEVPLDPYTLGALLGDGYLGKRGRQTVFSNQDQDILQKVEKGISEIGYKLSHIKNYDYNIRLKENSHVGGVGKLKEILEQLGLDGKKSNNKFIPDLYKFNSVRVRLAVLQGLIDTDGFANGSRYDITLASEQLIRDIQFICQSLGMTASYSTKKTSYKNEQGEKITGQLGHRLSIKTNKIIPKIHQSERREQQLKLSKSFAMRAIIAIEKLETSSEMTCISIDSPDNLFLTNDFVVTHNTHTAIGRVNFLLSQGVSPKKMALLTFTNNAGSEMALRLDPEKRAGIFVGTLHSYVNSLLLNGGIDTSRILREEEFDKLFDLLEENPHLYPKMEYLVIDESQDLDEKQFSFIESVDTRGFLVVGDDRQSIYGFAGASPDKLLGLARRDDVVIRELTRNYRNAKTILEYSNRIASRMQTSSSKIPQGMVSEEGLIRAIGDYDIYDLIRYTPSDRWSDWAILCRTNKRVFAIMAMLRRNRIPVSTFKQAQGSLDDLGKRMKENTVKVLTIHSCVVGDTLVHTSNGIKRIEDVVKRKDHDELVHDGQTYSKVKKFIDNGLAPVKLITTEMGSTIRVTDEHDVIVQTENGRVKKKAGELGVGEDLVLRQKFSYQGVDTLNEDLCFLAGMILRGGSLHDKLLYFSSTNKYDCIRFVSAFQQLGGGDFDLERGDQVYKVECHLTDTTILDALGMIDPLARRIPKPILEGSQVSHRHFLSGFFGENRAQPILKDEPLKEELQTILLALGVAYEFEEGGENLLSLALKEELAENLPDFRVERVKMIEQLGEEPTYCLEMEGEAQFLQNGFLMGNSKGLEFEKVILADKISRGEENQRLFYVAVTRAERELYMVL